MSFRGLYEIRDAVNSDISFIMATFLRGLYYGESDTDASPQPTHVVKLMSLMPKDVFMDNYKKFIQALISSPKTAIRVACLKEDPDVILGYSVLSLDAKTVHWVYVKKGPSEDEGWRKKGIGRSLVPATVTSVTHLTELGRMLLHKLPNCIYNPFNV